MARLQIVARERKGRVSRAAMDQNRRIQAARGAHFARFVARPGGIGPRAAHNPNTYNTRSAATAID